MNTMTLNPGVSPAAAPAPTRALGALLIVEALLSFAPVIVLGRAIGWPASLDLPAAEQLSRIHAEPNAVALGYGLYLLYSVLVAPLMIWLAARLCGGLQHPLAAGVAAFAALSTLARSIGILRWLTVMPALAAAHATADPGTKKTLELIFQAHTDYGGGIGELLGVSLFMAAALAMLCVSAWRRQSLPKPLAALGVLAALLLASLLLPMFGIAAAAPVAIAVSALSLWMLVTGVWLMRSAGTPG